MGLLNHLFGGKKGIARELILDTEKRIHLWQQHIADYPKREALAKHFSFANVDSALKNINTLEDVLAQLEELVSKDLVEIEEEERTDEEILADLVRLTSRESSHESEQWHASLVEEFDKPKIVLKILKKVHDVLVLELHTMRRIRQRRGNTKELLLFLFRLIFHQEAFLYNALNQKSVYEEVSKIVRAVLFEEKLKKEVQSDEDKFIRAMVEIMGNEESKHRYRKIGEEIFIELAELAGAPLSRDEDITDGLARMKSLMTDEELMAALIKQIEQLMMNEGGLFSIIRKLLPRSKYSDEKVLWVMKAFRKSYDLGHFIDLEGHFAT